MTKTKLLEDIYGGVWKYVGGFSGMWECDDGRYVQSTCCGSSPYPDGEPDCETCGGPDYWMYNGNNPTLRVNWTTTVRFVAWP